MGNHSILLQIFIELGCGSEQTKPLHLYNNVLVGERQIIRQKVTGNNTIKHSEEEGSRGWRVKGAVLMGYP